MPNRPFIKQIKTKLKNYFRNIFLKYENFKRMLVLIASASLFLVACNDTDQKQESSIITIAYGQMPAIASTTGSLQVVFGRGDSIMYTKSGRRSDTFSSSTLIGKLPNLVAYATRGPQICATKNGLAVIAVNKAGNIYSYIKDGNGGWTSAAKVNDVDTTDKEGFIGLGSDGRDNLFAIWTDLRNDKHNKLFGARSTDGGRTWCKNILVYASPDGNICECCKPSVIMKGQHIIVMFRNWLLGNRDLYLIQSFDGGQSFGNAVKLGSGSWVLNGCPMDGGGLSMNKDGSIETVWRRKSNIYACEPGETETKIGEGKNCTVETVDHKNIYAWTNNGNIICLLPNGYPKIIGKGMLPVLKSINDKKVVCIWENDGKIEGYILHLQ